MGDLGLIAIVAGAMLLVVVGVLVALTRLYHRVDRGSAVIVSGAREARVSFTGALVLPLLHHAESIALGVQAIVVDRCGAQGVVCRDSIRADLRVTFLVRINQTTEDVLKVSQSVGCARASDPAVLHELFAAKFTDAMEVVARQMDFAELHRRRDLFRDELVAVIGQDLLGFILDDVAIDRVEHTPLTALDPNNLFDAEGIRKLTEETARHNVVTHELRQRERMDIAQQELVAAEADLRVKQYHAEAEANHRRQLDSFNAPRPAGK